MKRLSGKKDRKCRDDRQTTGRRQADGVVVPIQTGSGCSLVVSVASSHHIR